MLAQYGVPAERLELEITETAIMTDPALALTVLRELDAMGIALAIDDFGTGYSSLAYLNELPVSLVKIDKTFVQNLEEGTSDAAIVRSTIDLARNLGYDVVARGVENQAGARAADPPRLSARPGLLRQPPPARRLRRAVARACAPAPARAVAGRAPAA